MAQDTQQEMFDEISKELLSGDYSTPTKINKLKTAISKKYKYNGIIKNTQIITNVPEEDRAKIIRILNVKPIRELSGVTVVALFAKPHSCPHGKCMYCPGGPDSPFGDTPQSYTGQEPAALRASRNLYDPYLQIFNRLEHYIANGHLPDKLELIFMGGTFPSLDQEYRDTFVYYVYKAINDFGKLFISIDENGKKSMNYEKFNSFFDMDNLDFQSKERELDLHNKVFEIKYDGKSQEEFEENLFEKLKSGLLTQEIRKNETAIIRSIGLTIETKPDWALKEHCSDMLRYGATRLELGVQTLNDECLKKTNRGHDLEDTKKAFQESKDMCFKINAHMMLGLPASNLEIDEESLKDLFRLPDYRPDMLKIYPCLVVRGTPLFKMYEMKLFKPLETLDAAKIIARSYKEIPRYVRVMRVQRDIPTTLVDGGVQKSNLRQYVDLEMEKLGVESQDIRAREIGQRQIKKMKMGTFGLKVEEFDSSKGKDFFIDVADENDTMIGFIRLRFPYDTNLMEEIDEKTALIRELHVYGQTIPVGGDAKDSKVQHKGWGGKLLKKAEEIAKERGFEKIAIISGVGVREYYRKFDYELEGPYMTKNL